MKKKDVQGVGHVYAVKVSGKVVPVRLLEEYHSYRGKQNGWIGVNLRTGRKIHVRTAAKLRWEIGSILKEVTK